MASLEQRNGRYRVIFFFDGRKFAKSRVSGRSWRSMVSQHCNQIDQKLLPDLVGHKTSGGKSSHARIQFFITWKVRRR